MKRTVVFAVITTLLMLAQSALAGEMLVRVTADRVNLRSKPSLETAVVGEVKQGDELRAKALGQEWVEIVPPASVDLWAYRDFVSGGVVQTKKLNVRAGPGMNFKVVGTLVRGDVVKGRGDFGDWLKIAPPASCSVWISRKYVETARPPAAPRGPVRRVPTRRRVSVPRHKVNTKKERAMPVPVPIAATDPSTSQANVTFQSRLPSDWELIPLEGQGKRVERKGEIRRSTFALGKPTHYRLMSQDDGARKVLCYIKGNSEQLNDWLGVFMIVKGREYWLQGQDYPVLLVDQIIPRPRVETR